MNRRDCMALLGGGVAGLAVLPTGFARAQPADHARHVAALMLYAQDDPEGQRRAAALTAGLEKRGWKAGENLQLDFQWGIGDGDWVESAVTAVVARRPDVILANGGSAMRPLQRAATDIPVVFIGTADPVAEGYVESLARPGGRMTGFTTLEPSVGAKLLELLKEIAPGVTRVAVMFNPGNVGSLRLSEAAITAAQRFALEVVAAPVRGPDEIEAAVTLSGQAGSSGLIVLPDPTTNAHRKLVIELAARRRLPAIHALREAALEGGLLSYGVNIPELFTQAAAYVDRLLRGEKPASLPVQRPTRFELVINLRTAAALGLGVPVALLARADEIVE